MKKYLIFLTIFFSIIFVPSVSAQDFKMNSNDYYNYMLASDDYIKSFPYINQNVFNNFENSLENTIDTSLYDYIILYTSWRANSSSATYGFHVLYFEKSQNVDFFLNTIYSTSYSSYWTLDFYIKTFSNVNYGILYYNLRDNSNYTFTTERAYGSSTINYFVGRFYRSSFGATFGIDDYSQGRDNDYGLYKTTIPLKYCSEDNNNITNLTVYDNSNNNKAYVLNRTTDYGITFLNTKMKLAFLAPPPPVLSFSTSNNYDSFNNLVSVNVRLNVSNYVPEYFYQFQKDGTSENWSTMQLEEDLSTGNYYFTWLFTQNTNLYVRVIDSNGNFITSSTLQVDGINSYENISSVIDLGSNNYGYFSNYVLVQNVKSTSENNLVSIFCERDRPFDNGFCSLYYDDLISNHSNIDYFNDTTFVFHTLFGEANNVLVSDKYYVFNFRVLKPFAPEVSNIVLSTNNGDINLINNIDKVYYNDGGSFTDYAIVFNTNNISFSSSYNLNSISVYFNIPLSNYYNNIPSSFTFSIYRSFKLSYFDNIPDSNDISNLFSINSLSSIDGVNSQNLFFTDTTFNTYGFSGIITAPFRLLYALEDYDTCSDINIPFPHSNQNLTLKCVRSSIPSSVNPLISILQIILSGLICYRIGVSTLALIKQVINPNDTGIEVLDL